MELTTRNKKYDLSAFKIPMNSKRKLKAGKKTMAVQHSKKVGVKEVVPKKPAVKKTTIQRNQRTIW